MAASKRSACFYQNRRVFTQQNELSTRTIFQHPTGLLAQLNAGTKAGPSLIAGDTSNTVTTLCGPEDGEQRSYTAYGHYLARNELHNPMAFNGEQLDLATGCYFLGNGYRLFNPVLMRFISPDSLSPFERGGVNAYAYCGGDPTNYVDPSGHSGFILAKEVFKVAAAISITALTTSTVTLIMAILTKSEDTKQKLEKVSIAAFGLSFLAAGVAGAARFAMNSIHRRNLISLNSNSRTGNQFNGPPPRYADGLGAPRAPSITEATVLNEALPPTYEEATALASTSASSPPSYYELSTYTPQPSPFTRLRTASSQTRTATAANIRRASM